MYSGGSGLSIDIHFVDIELSYDVLSPLPTLLSKHFNHPHPYIEIATAISDFECEGNILSIDLASALAQAFKRHALLSLWPALLQERAWYPLFAHVSKEFNFNDDDDIRSAGSKQ